jgi:hypothetical protein
MSLCQRNSKHYRCRKRSVATYKRPGKPRKHICAECLTAMRALLKSGDRVIIAYHKVRI